MQTNALDLICNCLNTLLEHSDVHLGWKLVKFWPTVQLLKRDLIMHVVDQTDKASEAAECFTE